MRQRSLGSAQLPVVGCGEIRLATATARGVDARDVARAVHEALGLGVRLVEASEEPDAERLCGDAIRALRLRDVAVLASRIVAVAPLPGHPNRDVLPERLPARYVQERVEATLRTTRLDVIPLVQLPLSAAWRSSPAWPELVGTCTRLVREGKAMQFAAYLADDDDLDAAAELANEPWLAALSVAYSACARRAAPLLAGPLPILARHPLAGGALAGTLGPGVRLAPADDRHALDDRALERIAVAVATLAPLVERDPPAARSCDAAKAALERAGRRIDPIEAVTVGELALRFVCDRAFALPRLHRREHLAEAIAAAAAPPLSPALRERIEALLA